mmetsp:Transcript_82768/g.233080  ORF Transcript_82768/g.233080 Transcript_82768/m.233080 type:complete len:874 (+) Transcript_82768:185-2806(+)
MTLVAKTILHRFGMVPCAVVVADRAPLEFPLLSAEGQAALNSNPDKVVKAFNYEYFDVIDKDLFKKDLQYSAETRDPFFHKFECNMMVLKGKQDASVDEPRKTTSRYKMSTLRIKGSNETFLMPVLPNTKVRDLTETLSSVFAFKPGAKLSASSAQGKELEHISNVQDDMIIDGLVDFKHPRYSWPHPVCIIGAGFSGTKMAMMYMHHKYENIVVFDRHAEAGGDAWLNASTKHSRVQTDVGAFNVWYGPEFTFSGDKGFGTAPGNGGRDIFQKSFKGPGAPPEGTGAGTGVDYHPVRAQVLSMMQYAAKEYGITEHTRFQTEVAGLKVIGDPEADDRYYELALKDLSTGQSDKTCKVSVVYHFAGAYDFNRIIDYPGEDVFGGQVGYGMGHQNQGGVFCFDDERMKGARVAILGNGAFAIENVRSCVENGAYKVFVVTRRKSLACPRLPCWFCHQGPAPTPSGMLLDMLKPMYMATGFGDPWDYYAVVTNASRSDVTIRQSSRFGIGDVGFLCSAYGLLEYRIDTLNHLTHHTLHLNSGEKLENIQHLCKALGLIGDHRMDKLHNLTYKIGPMANGDWRRLISGDATGMDAKRFTTFSAGPAALSFSQQWYYIHNHPWEYKQAVDQGMMKLLPVHKLSSTQPDQPIYMTNVQYEFTASVMLSSFFPLSTRVGSEEGPFKYCLLHSMHPMDKFHEYAQADWDRYQAMFRENNNCGDREFVPYPYTKEMVRSWFDEYSKRLGINITPSGPTEEFKRSVIVKAQNLDLYLQLEMIPQLVRMMKLHGNLKEGEDPFALATASFVYEAKKALTASSPESALDFDEVAYDSWRHWVAMDYTCSFDSIDCKSRMMLTTPEAWEKIMPCIKKLAEVPDDE